VEQRPNLDSALREAALGVLEYIGLLAEHDYKALQRVTGVSSDLLDRAVHLIQALNPRPATASTRTSPSTSCPTCWCARSAAPGRWS